MKTTTTPRTKRPAGAAPQPSAPDLQTQLEAILDAVWTAEANWRLDDRLDLANRSLPRR